VEADHDNSVIDPKSGQARTLSLSAECKGLLAGDNRHYLFELARLSPTDPYFLEATEQNSDYPHNVCFFRRELIEAFWSAQGVQGKKFAFNPDTHVSYLENAPEEDLKQLQELSLYLRTVVVPEVAEKLCAANFIPYDGLQLSDIMHEHGINMRYIDYLLEFISPRSLTRRKHNLHPPCNHPNVSLASTLHTQRILP
jgi:hypothetical protein